LGCIGSAADSIITELMLQFHSDHGEIRASCVAAVGQLQPSLQFQGPDGESLFEHLKTLLGDSNSKVVWATAGALAKYGTDVKDAAPALLKLLTRAVIHCDDVTADYMAISLAEIVPGSLDAFLTAESTNRDEDLQRQVIAAVKHVIVDYA